MEIQQPEPTTLQQILSLSNLLELDPASPAIDSGAGLSEYPDLPTEDISGNARPQGSGYDRGAHEKEE